MDAAVGADGADGAAAAAKAATSPKKSELPQREVAKLKAGDFFGETALLKNDVRNATVVARSEVMCLALDRENFNSLLGPLEELLANVIKERETVNQSEESLADGKDIPISAAAVSEVVNDKPKGGIMTVVEESLEESIEQFRIIGRGSFGRVKLVKHRRTGRIMAMKCMWKQHLVDHHQVTNVINEKTAMSEMSWHPFIIKLFGVYEDHNQLYFFLECLQGGELWSLLYQNQDALPRTNQYGLQEDVARLYAANVLEGFNCIHKCGYVYRDLKPENLLVASDGYLKIIDFGFAKKLRTGQKTQTLCSTPEYLSPEMILSQGHNRCTDYWAFGVLVYELLYGETPFCDDDQV